jgi:hypothetical protein
MPENVYKCPFSQKECRTCPIYRGRHAYVERKEGDEVPQPRILNRIDDWQEKFKEVVPSKTEEGGVEEVLPSPVPKKDATNRKK